MGSSREHVPVGISGDTEARDIRAREVAAAAQTFRAARTEELIDLLSDPDVAQEVRKRASRELDAMFYDNGLTGLS